MATDPLQSGAFGLANSGPVADPLDFSGIAPTPQTSAERMTLPDPTLPFPTGFQDPFDFTRIPVTPYQRPTPSVPPAPDSAYEQPVIAPYVAPVIDTGDGDTGDGDTGDGDTGDGDTGDGDTGDGDTGDGDTGDWTYSGHRGLRYQDGVLGIDPDYAATGYDGSDSWGWRQEDDDSTFSGYRDVFDPQEYLGMYYERLRRGQVDPIGGGYDIIREIGTDADGNDITTYRITGPSAAVGRQPMAGGGMIRGPSYLSGGIGSLGSTYLR